VLQANTIDESPELPSNNITLEHDLGAEDPVGRLGNPLNIQPGTNQQTTINGIDYTGHALDQMQGRGLMPSVVEDTITNGAVSAGRGGVSIYVTGQARVVVSQDGRIITAMPQ